MSRLRVLFISWSTIGGSGQSQRQLAHQLALRGHEALFLVNNRQPAALTRALYGHLSDLSVRLEGRRGARTVARLRNQVGRRTTSSTIDGLTHLLSPIAENALDDAVARLRPDVIIASSVDRWAWRRIHEVGRSHGTPTVLYLREESSLDHLATGIVPDLLIANTPSLAEQMRARGFPCAFVPSVVDVSRTATHSTRRAALAINPIPIKGSDLVWELAARLPHIPVVVQEAWPLDDAQLADVRARCADLPNVQFRRATPPGPGLYGDARLLLAPYRVDSRPRVVLEAQANGIPVVAADVPALVESVGDGGVCLPMDAVDEWVDTVAALWSDEERYAALVAKATSHARRPDVAPDAIAGRVEDLLLGVVGSGSGTRA